MKKADLEILKEILSDDKLDIRCALVQNFAIAQDRSELFVTVRLLPEGLNMNVKMSWDHVGPDAGIFQFPAQNDLVLVAFCEGHEDEGFIIRRLTSEEDKIPVQAVNGHLVVKARSGTKAFVNSDTEINLTREGPGDQRLVLGEVYKAAHSEHLGIDAAHTHIGNLGYSTFAPDQASQYQAIKASPVDDDAILSDLAKTEK